MANRNKNRAVNQWTMATKEFLRLVPNAKVAKKRFGRDWRGFDFAIDRVTIDIMYCSINSRGSWFFATSFKKEVQPDFYACFMAKKTGGQLSDGYSLFLIPSKAIAGAKSVQFREETKQPYAHFQIEPEELTEIFN